MPRVRLLLPLLAAMFFTHAARADAPACDATPPDPSDPQRVVVPFEFEYSGTTFGESVFILGDAIELGGGDPTRAIKMVPFDFPTWRVEISLPRGEQFTFRYVVRTDSAGTIGNPSNIREITDPGVNAGPFPIDTGAPVTLSEFTKLVFVQTDFANPVLRYRFDVSAPFESLPMYEVGPGRFEGETRYAVRGFGTPGAWMEFYAEEAGGSGREPNAGTLQTRLDALFVRDDQVFSYDPPPVVFPFRRAYAAVNPPTFFSSILNESRPYRVLLPRGYFENPTKRYPVLYMHDGQNVFENAPLSGTSWDADETSLAVTRSGLAREVILVAVDHGASRATDYLPPDDGFQADRYAQFLFDELKPFIDAEYRTLPGRAHTGVAGSSFGGVASLYIAWDWCDRVSRVGVFSPSIWAIPSLRNRIASGDKRAVRIYFDSGNAGNSNDDYSNALWMRDALADLGYALFGDLYYQVGFGQVHTETAWADRFDEFFAYAFSAHEADTSSLLAIPSSRLGDVNDDGIEDVEDFYQWSNGSGKWPDVDRDGVLGEPEERDIILPRVRALEAGDLIQSR